MIISFSNTPFVIACVVAILILAAHLSTLFLDKKYTRVITPVGACLYPVFIILMFFAGAELDLVVACILGGVFIYSLMSYLSYLKEKRRGEE